MRVTVTTTGTRTSWFAPKLRDALDSSGTSVRSLARSWRPADAENARRSLIRYLRNGIIPNPETRREIAVALGVEQDELEPDDEEEADQVSIDELLRRRIRHLLREERERA